MQKIPIELKGSNFTLLVLYLNSNDVDLINEWLYKKIQECPQFFKNAPIIVNVSNLKNEVNWKKIQEIIISHGFYVVGISGCKDSYFKKIIVKSGLPILLEAEKISKNKDVNSYCNDDFLKKRQNDQRVRVKKIKKTHIIEKPVRSGQKVYAKNSDLVIINNVSAGAELVADGNIHIYGSVRGRVLAGANGDITSKIFCTTLLAELVSVSGRYWLSDQIPSHFIGKSAQIYLKNKFLTITSLS